MSSGVAWAGEPPADVRPPVTAPLANPTGEKSVENPNYAWLTFEANRMRYEQPRYAGDARLYVREDNTTDLRGSPGAGRWRVYRGRDLDVITKANAELASAADMPALRTYVTTNIKPTTAPTRVTGTVRTSVEAPGWVYEPTTSSTARLFVRDGDGRETMYTGSDFDTIVRANPTFEQREGFQGFQTRVRQLDTTSPWTLRSDSATILNVSHTPTGVVVVSNHWSDGRWGTHTYEGQTLAEIQANQADLRAMLETRDGELPTGVTAPVVPAPVVPAPVGPAPAVPAGNSHPAWDVRPFGISLQAPTSCVNSQLNLEGRGVVVTKVTDGSTASTLGLQSDDVILEIDGRPVTDGAWARSQFDAWRADSQTKIIVLRKGNRMTLGR